MEDKWDHLGKSYEADRQFEREVDWALEVERLTPPVPIKMDEQHLPPITMATISARMTKEGIKGASRGVSQTHGRNLEATPITCLAEAGRHRRKLFLQNVEIETMGTSGAARQGNRRSMPKWQTSRPTSYDADRHGRTAPTPLRKSEYEGPKI